MIERPSPNHDARPAAAGVDILLLHYTGMETEEAALERMCDPAAKVSAHYMIGQGGAVTALVAEDRRAWHAGVSSWRGESAINARSIGVELANPGHEFGYRAFPERQMAALEALARDILSRHAIPAHGVLGHSDVAPLRKQDPGELFDWARLAGAGIGAWPGEEPAPLPALACKPGDSGALVASLGFSLGEYGYGVERGGVYDDSLQAIVTAFQRHFRPAFVDGVADGQTVALLERLLEMRDAEVS